MEANAFECDVLRKTFADVGLWPWNRDKILQNCREKCPAVAPLHGSLLVRKLLNIIKSMDEEKQRMIQQMLSEFKEEQVITEEEVVKKTAQGRQLAKKFFGDWKRQRSKSVRKTKKSRTINPARHASSQKRGRGGPRKNSVIKNEFSPKNCFLSSSHTRSYTSFHHISTHIYLYFPLLFTSSHSIAFQAVYLQFFGDD